MSEVGVNGMHNISEPEWKPIGKEGYREGYLKALEDVQNYFLNPGLGHMSTLEVADTIEKMKSAYEKEQNDGN